MSHYSLQEIKRRGGRTFAVVVVAFGILATACSNSREPSSTIKHEKPTTSSSEPLGKYACQVARKTLYLPGTQGEVNTFLVEPNKVANVVLGVIYQGQQATINEYSFVNKHLNLSAPLSRVTVPIEAYITTSFEPPTETTINLQPEPNHTLSVTMSTCAYSGSN